MEKLICELRVNKDVLNYSINESAKIIQYSMYCDVKSELQKYNINIGTDKANRIEGAVTYAILELLKSLSIKAIEYITNNINETNITTDDFYTVRVTLFIGDKKDLFTFNKDKYELSINDKLIIDYDKVVVDIKDIMLYATEFNITIKDLYMMFGDIDIENKFYLYFDRFVIESFCNKLALSKATTNTIRLYNEFNKLLKYK